MTSVTSSCCCCGGDRFSFFRGRAVLKICFESFCRNFERRAAQPFFESNLALKSFFANTRNMAYNKQSPWSAVSLQPFCLVFSNKVGLKL